MASSSKQPPPVAPKQQPVVASSSKQQSPATPKLQPLTTMERNVPVVKKLEDIYFADELKDQADRWTQLRNRFEREYGHLPQFISRSPGRVNIIGEHIDYSLFPVLPMAISADVLLAVSVPKENAKEGHFTIRIANEDSTEFPTRKFDFPYHSDIPIDARSHDWTNYFKAGLRGALDHLRNNLGLDLLPRDMNIYVNGNVPPAGGLSSSAALVTASALAVLAAHGVDNVKKLHLTELAIKSERAVGVNSGGMDQAASVFSEKGSALFVSFAPELGAGTVQFPKADPEFVFMIAQSYKKSDKKVTGPYNYNLRVVECTLAALGLFQFKEMIPGGSDIPTDQSPLGLSLGTMFDTYWQTIGGARRPERTVIERLEYFVNKIPEMFPGEGKYGKEEIAKVTGLSVEQLDERYINARFPVIAEQFRLRKRAKHVYSEALRVYKFLHLLESTKKFPVTPGKEPETKETHSTQFYKQLGALLNESQTSCHDNFGCSTAELELICKLAREAGSVGSRLTGAGWGGATVHLVPIDRVEAVRDALNEGYYKKLVVNKKINLKQYDNAVIVSRPGSGSALYPLDRKIDYIVKWGEEAGHFNSRLED